MRFYLYGLRVLLARRSTLRNEMLFILKDIACGVARNVTPRDAKRLLRGVLLLTQWHALRRPRRVRYSRKHLHLPSLLFSQLSTRFQHCSINVWLKFPRFEKKILKLVHIINKSKIKLKQKFSQYIWSFHKNINYIAKFKRRACK